jgi:hypothetical protein
MDGMSGLSGRKVKVIAVYIFKHRPTLYSVGTRFDSDLGFQSFCSALEKDTQNVRSTLKYVALVSHYSLPLPFHAN